MRLFLLIFLLNGLFHHVLLAAVNPADLDEAALLFNHGRFEEALTRLQRPAARERDPLKTDLLLGLTLQRLGRMSEAVAPLTRAFALAPNDLEVAIDLGLVYQATGQFSEATKVFNAAAQTHPTRPEPWLGLGSVVAARGRWQEALSFYQKAVDLGPQDASAWVALSDAQVSLGQLRPAVASREKALALDPNDRELRFKQAVGWYGLGEFAKAASHLAKAELGDKPEVYFLTGSLDFRRGDLAGAERNFSAALQAKADYPEAHLNLGITFYNQHRYAEAIEEFGKIRWNQADHALAKAYSLESAQAAVDQALRDGATAVLAGDFVAAVGHWDRAETLAVDKATVQKMLSSLREQQKPRAEALATEADRAMVAGDLQKAVLFWNDALSIDPDNARAKAGMRSAGSDLKKLITAMQGTGQRLIADGDLAGARVWALRLTKIDSGAGRELSKASDAAARLQISVLEDEASKALAAGKPDQAIVRYERALALAPLDPRLKGKKVGAERALHAKLGHLLALALVQEADGQYKVAYDLSQEALVMEPSNLEARQSTARLAKRLNLKRLDPKAVEDLYYRGVYIYGNGETQTALDLWKEALSAAPNHGPLLAAVRSAETKLRSLARLRAR